MENGKMILSNDVLRIQDKKVTRVSDGKDITIFEFLKMQIDMSRVQGGMEKVVKIREKFNADNVSEIDFTDEEIDVLIKIVDSNPLGERVAMVAPVLYTLMAIRDEIKEEGNIKLIKGNDEVKI